MNKESKNIKGDVIGNSRGRLKYYNYFYAEEIKRLYIIENSNTELIRGWKAHKIEQRWFMALTGSFKIEVVAIEDFDNPMREKEFYKFQLELDKMNFLHCPFGHDTLIRALESESKGLAMGDFLLDETKDKYRSDVDYFINISKSK